MKKQKFLHQTSCQTIPRDGSAQGGTAPGAMTHAADTVAIPVPAGWRRNRTAAFRSQSPRPPRPGADVKATGCERHSRRIEPPRGRHSLFQRRRAPLARGHVAGLAWRLHLSGARRRLRGVRPLSRAGPPPAQAQRPKRNVTPFTRSWPWRRPAPPLITVAPFGRASSRMASACGQTPPRRARAPSAEPVVHPPSSDGAAGRINASACTLP